MIKMAGFFDLGIMRAQRELALDDVPVQGALPAWLRGTLVRNGPGAFEVGDRAYRHWFDGLAMLHRFSFADGRVSYANKFLDAATYRKTSEQGRISYREFATDPCPSLFGRFQTIFTPKTPLGVNPKVAIGKIAGEAMALGETPMQVSFDVRTLQTAGVYDFTHNGHVTTAHPQTDVATGDAFNLSIQFSAINQYQIVKLLPRGKSAVMAKTLVRKPAYLHSFGMSDRYFMIAEFPYVVDTLELLMSGRPFIENFKWQPQQGTTFLIFDRNDGSLVKRVEAEPFFAFHHINAQDRDGEVVLDIAAYDDAEIVSSFYLHRLSNPNMALPHGHLRRYRVPLSGGDATRETISSECVELPRYDQDRLNARPYQFLYAMSMKQDAPAGMYNQLVKLNVQSGAARHWHAAGCWPGEGVFVRRLNAQAEDDGVVLSIVLDSTKRESFLLVLDAQSFTEIARATLPEPVLLGFHSEFFNESDEAAGAPIAKMERA
jgi:carotenoid cleavage dioxygenase-like enzyme